MGDINQTPLKISHHSIRENQEKKIQERKRNILYLIHSFLKENCLENTAECLEKEAHLLSNFEVCDNVDLDTILQEYNSYYFTKFSKYPKICKKVNKIIEISPKKPTKVLSKPKKKIENDEKGDEFEISVKQIGQESINTCMIDLPVNVNINYNNYPQEWKEIFQVICKEIIPKTLGVKWSDCIGMDNIISLLQEAIIYPFEYPQIFDNIYPWKGVLLYGPPGVGKTIIAKALACESNRILINVSPSTFVSKWRGESEKLIKCLFEVAKNCAPCTVFIDEIDAIASKREEQQHEASRRFKSELLTQMDGILNNNEQIFILASTNLPWEVDGAILRRFDKKIYVDLPSKKSRVLMFKKFINNDKLQLKDLENFADKTENYSGNDIKLICKNAAMCVVRKNIDQLKKNKYIDNNCTPDVEDIEKAIINAKSSTGYYKQKYLDWQKNFGGI